VLPRTVRSFFDDTVEGGCGKEDSSYKVSVG